MGFALCRGLYRPVLCLRTVFLSDAIEEGGSCLFIDRGAGVNHMAVHRCTELYLATQLGMIDDMGAVGLEHILNDTHGLGIILLLERLGGQLLVAAESRRKDFGMLAGNIVQVIRLQMARCQRHTIVNGAEGKLVAHHVGLVEGRRDLRLKEDEIGLYRRIGCKLLADSHGIRATIHMMVGGRRDVVNDRCRAMLLVELLNDRQVDNAVAHLVVVAVLSCAVIAIAHTVTAIQVADVCLTLSCMHTSPVSLVVVAVGILRIVFLHNR